MKTRILALVMALLMLCSCSALAENLDNINLDSTWPIVKEKRPLSITVVPAGGANTIDEDNFWMIRYFNEVSNLDIDWKIIDNTAAEEQINLMLNSDSMPDAILGYGFDYSKVARYGVQEGLFYNLADLLDYAPNWSALLSERPELRAAITAPDGGIYGLPNLGDEGLYVPLRFYMNVHWLEQLGLEMPRTLDDLYSVLCAFRDNDMNGNGDKTDEIPWSGSWSEHWSERALILNAFGLVTCGENMVLDYSSGAPELAYIPYTDAYLDYLTYMNKLWNEGLLDPDMFTQTYTQVGARILDNRVGMAGMDATVIAYPDDATAYESLYALTKDKDATPTFPGAQAVSQLASFVISSSVDKETAATLLNFLDAAMTVDSYKLFKYGPEKGDEYDYWGYGLYFDPETNNFARKMPDGATDEWSFRINYLTFWNFPGYVATGSIKKEMEYAKANPDTTYGMLYKDGYRMLKCFQEGIDRQSAYAVSPLPSFFMSESDLDRLSDLNIPLENYVATMEANFITGVEPLENFEAFREMLRSLNVEEYLSIYNTYWAAYQANMNK